MKIINSFSKILLYPILSLTIIALFSCSLEKMSKELKGFQKPDENVFKNRIKDIFGIEIDNYDETQQNYSGILPREKSKNTKLLLPRYGFISEAESQPIVHLTNRYISWEDPEEDNTSLLHLNKYIFYNDEVSFSYLKTVKSGYLYYLVLNFGYIKDEKLVDFIIDEIGLNPDREETNDFASKVFIGSNGIFGKRQLRKELIKRYFQKYPTSEYMYFNLADRILNKKRDNGENYEGNRYEDAAFLLEIQLEYSKEQLGSLIFGGVDYILKKYPEFFVEVKNKNGFNNQILSNYKLYNEDEEEIIGYVKIQDPDGYSNMRESNNSNSKIIEKINSGEGVFVLKNDGEWLKVETKEGKQGYVHKSRIKS